MSSFLSKNLPSYFVAPHLMTVKTLPMRCRRCKKSRSKQWKSGKEVLFFSLPEFLYTRQSMANPDVQMPTQSHLTLILKVRYATDYILHMPHCAASYLRSRVHSGGTALNRDTVGYFDESVCPECVSGNSLEVTQAKFEQRKKKHWSLDSILLRQNHGCP